jgi:hypothetical protein
MTRRIPIERNEQAPNDRNFHAAIPTNEFSWDDFLGSVVLGRKREKSRAIFAFQTRKSIRESTIHDSDLFVGQRQKVIVFNGFKRISKASDQFTPCLVVRSGM